MNFRILINLLKFSENCWVYNIGEITFFNSKGRTRIFDMQLLGSVYRLIRGCFDELSLRSKKAGRLKKLLGFARSHFIVPRGSVSLSCATTPVFLNLDGTTVSHWLTLTVSSKLILWPWLLRKFSSRNCVENTYCPHS